MVIYKITNLLNGKCYVGQTSASLALRWQQHCKSNYCRLLSAAINKYGKENFSIEVLETCSSIEEMNIKEPFYIAELNTLSPNGYNLLPGGMNKKHHNQTREIMSQKRRGVPMRGLAAKGVPRGKRPPEVGLAISKAKKGRSNSLKGTKRPYVEKPSRYKPVEVENLITGEIIQFEAIKFATKAMGLDKQRPNVMKVLKGERKQVSDFTFRYLKSKQEL